MPDDADDRTRHRIMKAMTLSMRAGEVLLASSVSTAEVDQELRRLTHALGLVRCQVSVTLNSITLSYVDHRLDLPVTLVSVVDGQEERFDRLDAVAGLLRRVERGDVQLDDAYGELERIDEMPVPLPVAATFVASLASVAAWVIFAGGGVGAAAAGVAGALLVTPLLRALHRTRVPEVFGLAGAAFVVVAVPYGLAWAGFDVRVQAAVAGGLYPLLPGGVLVASVTDGLSGAPISGLAKGLQAVVFAGALAVGVVGALQIAQVLEIDPSRASASWPLVITTVAAGVAVGAFAAARAVPARAIAWIMGLAMVCWVISQVGPSQGYSDGFSTFAAAGVLGFGGQVIARSLRTSSTVLTGNAVYVLVPGVAMYLAMLSYVQGAPDAGLDLALQAVRTAVGVAAGTALGVALGATVPGRPAVGLWRPARPARATPPRRRRPPPGRRPPGREPARSRRSR